MILIARVTVIGTWMAVVIRLKIINVHRVKSFKREQQKLNLGNFLDFTTQILQVYFKNYLMFMKKANKIIIHIFWI